MGKQNKYKSHKRRKYMIEIRTDLAIEKQGVI